MVLGDSLLVMTSLAEKEALKGQVQCIYMDPPYGIKFNSNWQPSTKSRKVKEGQEGLTRDPEMIRAFRDTWKDGVHSYLSYLRDRVAAAHVLLASEGSIFLQIGEENLHLVRSVLQEIFLPENFVVTFAIQKTGSVSGDFVQSNLNYILWFAKNIEAAKDKFHALFKYRSSSGFERSSENSLDRTDFEAYPLTSEGNRETTTVPFKFQGKSYHPGEDRHWGVLPSGLERVAKAGRILPQKNQIRLKYFEDDFPVLRLGSSWNDVGGATDKIYVVQTTPKVIERCILLTTDPGDLVLDPTCGSGTTAIVAEQWGRRWITIDTSRVALALARQRLMAARYKSSLLSGQ
jgi:adenine-specific DNA-methyltransferase